MIMTFILKTISEHRVTALQKYLPGSNKIKITIKAKITPL
jgi:hypothetical protein